MNCDNELGTVFEQNEVILDRFIRPNQMPNLHTTKCNEQCKSKCEATQSFV